MNNRYISGFDEADAVLRDLPTAVENKVLTKAARAGANVWRKNLRANAPRHRDEQSAASKKYGPLHKNIKTVVLKSAKAKGRRGVRVTTGNAFWGYIIEFGHSLLAAAPWFRPTVESSRDEAEAAVKEALGTGIEAEATKLARKHGIF